jgi:hypothetical protein
MLLSCVNCSFNPLLADSLGTGDGYCTKHRVVLHQPRTLTCGRLLRKDLGLPDAERERAHHEAHYPVDRVTTWRDTRRDAAALRLVDTDITQLNRHDVGRAVTEYASAGGHDDAPKMMFLGQLDLLSRHGDARAELAQHSMGRTYVRDCVTRDGRDHWTSANYLLAWAKELLATVPRVDPSDLSDAPLPQTRKVELAQWEVVMLRVQFVADVAFLAPDDDPVAALRELPEKAARAANDVALPPLMKWLATKGWDLFDAAFPTERFRAIQQAKRPVATRRASVASEPPATWPPSAGRQPRAVKRRK